MLKKQEFVNPNRMKFESLHRTFNRQVNCISTGNVFAATQTSSYVRAYNTLECNGRINEPGHLQEWDLNDGALKRFDSIVKDWIRENVKDKDVIAYKFYHYYGERQFVDGYVITTGHKDGYKLLKRWYFNHTKKGMSIIDEAMKYIVEA